MRNLKIIILLHLILFVSSCGTVQEAFTNQKKNSSDEFLVEKKSPLVMPPDYGELPTPNENSNNSQQNSETNTIENLLSNGETTVLENDDDPVLNQNLEKSIIDKIKKN